MAWMGLWKSLAVSGWLMRFDRVPPPMAMMIASVVVLAVIMGIAPLGRDMAMARPLAALIGLQAFRLPLEVIIHRAASIGIAPAELTYTGYNFDIATGAGAAVIAALLVAGVAVPRAVLWIWNAWGVYCLAAILVIAIAGSPIAHRFGTLPGHLNTWVLFEPYVWLPTVMVTIAIAGHIVVTRKLLADR